MTTDLVFTEQTITLGLDERYGQGHQKQVAAHVCGPFAYHASAWRRPELDDGTLTVTHVPTGMMMVAKQTEDTARAFIAKALSVKGVDWQSSDMDYFRMGPILYKMLWHLGKLIGRKRPKKEAA
jgi:hypothetical protein